MERVERNKALVRRFVELTNARDFDGLDEIVVPDFVRICPSTPGVVVRSREALRTFLEADGVTFPDNRVRLIHLVGEGDRVAFWATYTGTQLGPIGPFPPSGRAASVEFAGIFRLEGERIAELKLVWDNVGLLVQLGHLSPEKMG
jgi:steroid delta-isomerase-like uncharacterized protein